MLLFAKPRGRRRAVKPVALTAIETMIASLPPRDSLLTELMAYQGLRPGEARALADTSIRDRTGRVEHIARRGKDTKTSRIRTVNFLRPVPQDLAAYQLGTRRNRAAGCLLLFPRPDGNPWRDTDYRNWRRRVFRPSAVAAGIATSTVNRLPDGTKRRRYNGPRPYDLRHTFVSLLIQEGRSIAYVAEQAGHTVEECAHTYTHLFDEYRDARPVPAEELIRRARARVEQGRTAL
jgi:integrase